MFGPPDLAAPHTENRTKLLAKLEAEGTATYPHKFDAKMQLAEYVQTFAGLADGARDEATETSIAGRIGGIRLQGKLLFIDIRGDGVKVQVMTDAKTYATGEEAWSKVTSAIRRGDILGVKGYPGKSMKGELSIFPTFMQVSESASARNLHLNGNRRWPC